MLYIVCNISCTMSGLSLISVWHSFSCSNFKLFDTSRHNVKVAVGFFVFSFITLVYIYYSTVHKIVCQNLVTVHHHHHHATKCIYIHCYVGGLMLRFKQRQVALWHKSLHSSLFIATLCISSSSSPVSLLSIRM